MFLVDSHCHFHPDHDSAPWLDRARSAGVGAFVAVGVGSDTREARTALALAKSNSDIFAVVGAHPHDAESVTSALFEELEELARSPEVVAVGEIGLDYHYDHASREAQRAIFRRFVAAARRLRKPIVIHTREAPDDTLAILSEEGASDVGGVIHCFSEDVPFARQALDLGFDLSFSGILTFKNSESIRQAAVFAPPDRILVETDSPYLAPVPFRGRRCEPAYVVHTATVLATLRGVSLEQIAETTTENAKRRLRLNVETRGATIKV